MANEAYVKGRKAGVEGTYGEKRKIVAEKTVFPHSEGEGGGEDGLPAVARSLYKKAIKNGGPGDGMGDQALTDR